MNIVQHRKAARKWTLKNRGVLRAIAVRAEVSKSYVTMILTGARGGELRAGSKRKTVEQMLRKAGAPVSEKS